MIKLNEIFERWGHQRETGEVLSKPEGKLRAMPVLLANAGAPPDAIEALQTARPTEAMELAKRWIELEPREGRTLVLFGQRGVGKTVAAAYGLGRIMQRIESHPRASGDETRRGQSGLFVRAGTMDRWLTDREWFERLLKAACLVVDDLGKEPNSELFRTRLFELLDTRHGERRRTVVTGNLSKQLFAERYGSTLADRLRDGCLSAYFEGESMRGAL